MTLGDRRAGGRHPAAREFRRLLAAGVPAPVALLLADPEGRQLHDTRAECRRLVALGVSPVVALTIAERAARQVRAHRRARYRHALA